MPRNRLSKLVVTEVSLVDMPANKFARVLMHKRDPEPQTRSTMVYDHTLAKHLDGIPPLTQTIVIKAHAMATSHVAKDGSPSMSFEVAMDKLLTANPTLYDQAEEERESRAFSA